MDYDLNHLLSVNTETVFVYIIDTNKIIAMTSLAGRASPPRVARTLAGSGRWDTGVYPGFFGLHGGVADGYDEKEYAGYWSEVLQETRLGVWFWIQFSEVPPGGRFRG
jgi:hypothetical protein